MSESSSSAFSSSSVHLNDQDTNQEPPPALPSLPTSSTQPVIQGRDLRLETLESSGFTEMELQLKLTSGQSSRMRTIVLQSYGQQPLRITEGRLLMPTLWYYTDSATKLWSTTNTATEQGNTLE